MSMNLVIELYKGTRSKLKWPTHYRASGDVPIEFRDVFRSSGCAEISTLSLKGLRVDTIRYRFEVNTAKGLRWQTQKWGQRSRFEKAEWKDWRHRAFDSYGYASGMRRPIFLRLWSEVLKSRPDLDIVLLARSMFEAITSNLDEGDAPLEEADFHPFCTYMAEIYDAWGGSFKSSHTRFHRSFDMLRQHGAGGTNSRYQYLMESTCSMRRCFITEDGRVGVGPTSMKKGDTVVVLLGGGTPLCPSQVEREMAVPW